MTTKAHLILYTGGTIGMVKSDHGYVPDASLPDLLQARSAFADYALQCITLSPIIDSAAMSLTEWQQIIDAIHQHFDASVHRSVIILHGTDTLAYTAGMLSFAMAKFPAPIVVTGSMRSIHFVPEKPTDKETDGWANILTAIQTAEAQTAGTWVAFAGKTMHGARVSKLYRNQDDAFIAPNANPAFHVSDAYLEMDTKRLVTCKISQLNFTPLVSLSTLEALLSEQPDYLILGVYGSGTVPDLPDLFARLKEANDQGLITVASSQSPYGALALGAYAASNAVTSAGCVGSYDMTLEAVVSKCWYLHQLGQSVDTGTKRRLYQQNLINERSD